MNKAGWSVLYRAWPILLTILLPSSGVCDSTDAQHPVSPPIHYNIQDVVMGLRRTGCFGTCPAYSICIRGDGSGTYKGEMFVGVGGEHEFHLARSSVVELLNGFVVIDFTSLKDSYTEGRGITVADDGAVQTFSSSISDVPHMILTMQIRDYSKKIEFNHNYGLKVLIELADRFDQITESSQWTRRK